MSLPRAWSRLPGPADFLDAITEDLIDRNTVVVGLPRDVASRTFVLEMADLLKRRGFGNLTRLKITETGNETLRQSNLARLRPETATGSVLWIDATDDTAVAQDWVNQVAELSDFQEVPRLLIPMHEACAARCKVEKHQRRRLWSDFVTRLDTRVLVERIARQAGHKPLHVSLKSTLIAEIADSDLSLAERMSQDPLGRTLEKGRHPDEKVWAAQLTVLFPLVDRERRRLLITHQAFWHLPHIRKDGTEVSKMENLEIGDMATQALASGPLEADRKRFVWLRGVRNALAHCETVPWATLTSPVGIQIMDFR